MLLTIDLSHSRTWQQATLAHLREVLAELHDGDTILDTVDAAWRPDTLAGTDLLLLPISGRAEHRPFTSAEAAALAAFLDGGGAVLAFGDGDSAPLPVDPALREVLGPFAVAEHVLSTARTDLPHALAHDVLATSVGDHAIGTCAATVRIPRTRPLQLPDGTAPLLSVGDHVVAAVTGRGPGRVVLVGSAEPFTLPYLGHHDNLRFLLGMLAWLSTGTVSEADLRQAEKALADRTFAGRNPVSQPAGCTDLTLLAGDHALDAMPYRDDIVRVGADPLPDPHAEPEAFLEEAALRFHELPRPIRRAVGRFGTAANDYGVLLVRGLPVGDTVPPTPADAHERPGKPQWLAELWLAAFASALGTPFAYLQEQSGALFQNVVPTPGNASKISSESSAIELGFHTEMGFHPHLPDHLLLMCLRPDHDQVARTITAGVRTVLPELTLRQRAVLSEPLFRPGIDYSFGSPDGTEGNGPALAVLHGDPHDPFLNFDFDLMVGLTDEAQDALQAMRAATNRVQRHVRLTTGDLLIIDNRRAAHARSQFTARYDGRDRWLQRMCVIRDLQPAATDRIHGGRVVGTVFAT